MRGTVVGKLPRQIYVPFSLPLLDSISIFLLPSLLPSPQQAAPILCAGVTTYSGIKATEARPGQFLTVIGAAGGLGHLAVQFGVAMGLRVLALDVGADKLEFCTETLGAEAAFEATDPEVAAHVRRREGGTEGGCDSSVFQIEIPPSLPPNILLSRSRYSFLPLSLPHTELSGHRSHQGRLARRPLPRSLHRCLQVRRGALPSRRDDCDGWVAERRFAIEYF